MIRRFKICDLRFKILVVLLVLIINHQSLIINPVFAADSTQSAKQASASSSLLEKINQIKEQVASKAAKLKENVNQKLSNKFTWGKVLNISEEAISLENTTKTKNVLINEFTEYVTDRTPRASDIKADDYIAALGDLDDKGNLGAKKVIKISKPKESKIVYWGQIVKISGEILTLKTKDGDKKIDLGENISYFYGTQEATSSAMAVNSTIVASGYLHGDILTSGFIYIIPQSVNAAR